MLIFTKEPFSPIYAVCRNQTTSTCILIKRRRNEKVLTNQFKNNNKDVLPSRVLLTNHQNTTKTRKTQTPVMLSTTIKIYFKYNNSFT